MSSVITWRSVLLAGLLVALWASNGASQSQTSHTTGIPAARGTALATHDSAGVPVAQLAAFGVVGGVAGFFAGVKLGHDLERAVYFCSCDDPGLIGAIAGAFIGPALAIPLSVYFANGGNGNLSRAYASSLLIGVTGFAVTYISGGAGILLVPVLPVLEIVTSIRAMRR